MVNFRMTFLRNSLLALTTPLLLMQVTPALAEPLVIKNKFTPSNSPITKPEVVNAQNAWCNALVDISKTNDTKGKAAATALAKKVIDSAYGYQMGGVLFKPTLAKAPQTFRTTSDGALSYFVGGNPAFPSDKGFALMGWKQCTVKNSAIFISADSATSMGNVSFLNKDGKTTIVDKTWTFVKDPSGNLRIVVHHSSL